MELDRDQFLVDSRNGLFTAPAEYAGVGTVRLAVDGRSTPRHAVACIARAQLAGWAVEGAATMVADALAEAE